jgi:flagella synthesis protein FlgN
MSLNNNEQQEIKQVFQREIECARMLMQSLDQEYEALAEHHADALEEVVRDKQERIQQLESISKQREKLLVSFVVTSVKNNDQQDNNYQFGDNKQLADLWNELVDIAEKCRDKNRVNGSIVELVSKQSRHALDILHGILPDTSSISELYDNTGQAIKSANKRSLVQV